MDRSLFAQRDEYRLGITNRKYTVRLGDQIFAQSPLSLNGMIGSGASAKVSLGRWTTGFASGSDRFTPGAGVERAAFLGMEPNERWNLSTNVVHSSQFGGATLGTLYARFTPTQHEIFEIERGARLGGVNSAATLLRASGQRGQLTFDVHHEAADSGYQNLLGASRQDWATLMYRPHRLLRFSGRIDDRMSTGAPIPYSSGFLPSSRRSGLLATMGVDIGSNLSAGVRSFEGHEENSASNVVAMVDAERSVWGRFRMRLPGVMITSAAERGISDDPFGGPRRSFSATTVQAEVPLFGRASFAGFVDHSTGLRRSASVADELLTVGGSAQIQMGSLTASMSAAGKPAFLRRQPSDTLQPELAWLDATLAYQSSPGRTLTFRVRSMAAGIRMPNNTSARISYSMPLRMPVGRSKSTGRVVGRVYDAETGMGIANALVRVGEHSALTDDDGRIVIGGVAPSQYPVYVDLGSRQASGLGFQEPSMQISTRAGYTSEMLMGVVRMGRLRGHLQLFELIDVPRLLGDSVRQQKKGGLSGIVVTLINGTEERRVVSDSGGWFELRDARPGTWRVVVPTSELPAQHFVEGDSVRIVDLAAGATSNIEINVRPRQRRILPLDAVPTIPPMIPSGGTSPAREKVAPPVVRDVRDSAQVARPRTTQGADAVPSARDNGSGAGDTDAHAPRRRALPSMQHRTSTALRVSLTSKQPTMRKPGTQKTPKKPTPFTLASYGSEWEIGFANVTGGTN
ncbi:MAG: carboxypeptidase-like regulatory domain-containing protein [bacterium]